MLSLAVPADANNAPTATSAEFGPRLLSDQLSDYRVDDPYIQAHLHGPGSRLVFDLDEAPIVLRDEEVMIGTVEAAQAILDGLFAWHQQWFI